MKLPLFIFIVYLHYSLCDIQNITKAIDIVVYPKKVRHGLPQYHEAGKYVKAVEKKPGNNKDFTTFPKPYPKSQDLDHQIVPDSPYFPVDALLPEEKRSRVKKNLSSYTLQRHKRSADIKTEDKTIKTMDKPGRRDEGGIKRSNTPGKRTGQGGKKKPTARNQKQRLSQSGNQKKKLSDSAGRVKLTKKVKRAQLRQGAKKLKRSQARTSKNKALKGSPGLDTRRLIAGRDALIEDYPYVVSIQKDKQHWCSGALLNPSLVITTANCLWKSKAVSRMRVRAGSRHTDRDGQMARIQEVLKHPGWKIRQNPDNDVAFILLDRNIRFSHSVHGVDLPNRVMMPAFDDAWVTSWGSDRKDGVYNGRDMSLQAYHTRLMERGKCSNITQRFGVSVNENFICFAQTGRRAPCTRDTGAPAVSDGVLWGLASWGIRKSCGTERYPAMFSYLASQSNMDFIVKATIYLMSDQRQYSFLDKFPMPKVLLTTTSSLTA